MEVPSSILLVVGVLRRHSVNRHNSLVAALHRAVAGTDNRALGRSPGHNNGCSWRRAQARLSTSIAPAPSHILKLCEADPSDGLLIVRRGRPLSSGSPAGFRSTSSKSLRSAMSHWISAGAFATSASAGLSAICWSSERTCDWKRSTVLGQDSKIPMPGAAVGREFITLLGGAAAWPVVAQAQQPAVPVIGYLDLAGGALNTSPYGRGFLEGLAQAGYVPGPNLAIELRGANFQGSILPRLAADPVARKVDVIVTIGSRYAAVAAKAATSTIPIVFMLSEDPMEYGLVASFNRPGNNVTGVTFLSADLMGKRLNLLLELVPQATTVGYLCPPSDAPIVQDRIKDILAAGRALGRKIVVLEVRRLDFEVTFATAVDQQVGALIVGNYTW
jgi:hypothetical protein